MPRRVPDKYRLLHGPYEPPPLRRGQRTTCLYRDALVVVTGWSEGRIPWPRCRAIGHRGGSGLLVCEELARAIRTESAASVEHWWGVSGNTVTLWRKTLGVEGWTGTRGTRRLVRAASLKGAARTRGKPLCPEQVERRRRRALELNLGQYLDPAHGAGWCGEELALLGKLPDAEVARQTGRSKEGVRQKREELGIANPEGGKPGWAEGELALLGKLPDAEVARLTGRSERAATQKRHKLRIPTADDLRRLTGRRTAAVAMTKEGGDDGNNANPDRRAGGPAGRRLG